jgi:hypothetical protein
MIVREPVDLGAAPPPSELLILENDIATNGVLRHALTATRSAREDPP